MNNKQVKFPRIALIFTLVLLISLATPMASAQTALINNGNAKIYAASGESGSLPRGTTVNVKQTRGSWAKISYHGATGYIKIRYLTAEDGIDAYIKKNTSIYKSADGDSKMGTLQAGTKVEVVGKCGSYCQVTNGKAYGYVKASALSKNKPATSWTSKVKKLEWFDGGSGVLDRGDYGHIYDIHTGITLRIKRMGGTNHADVEPATKTDTAKLLKISGGEFSWESLPVILYADGQFVAAAINTMPHGDQTIYNNGYDGQFCLHMLGSKTHGSDSINEEHQKSILEAYNWAKTH